METNRVQPAVAAAIACPAQCGAPSAATSSGRAAAAAGVPPPTWHGLLQAAAGAGSQCLQRRRAQGCSSCCPGEKVRLSRRQPAHCFSCLWPQRVRRPRWLYQKMTRPSGKLEACSQIFTHMSTDNNGACDSPRSATRNDVLNTCGIRNTGASRLRWWTHCAACASCTCTACS